MNATNWIEALTMPSRSVKHRPNDLRNGLCSRCQLHLHGYHAPSCMFTHSISPSHDHSVHHFIQSLNQSLIVNGLVVSETPTSPRMSTPSIIATWIILKQHDGLEECRCGRIEGQVVDVARDTRRSPTPTLWPTSPLMAPTHSTRPLRMILHLKSWRI
ncbi:hypothetical protein SAMD00019534_110280 [Acytostelium subglobosum LB1]|uniref:hypothetical protein n=1 Tax=Acytostelium subglobosum LB1 TaxID=1410327 RepID=UPI000644FD56|nr:hypothetical protein SAMD00019534_110280 [Acytostelium subglobosum LB1]GAM27852.1 hypothetical protein SAMD00019534_110280 [Acytostelium subglobosum LB1]|eukprot:XP_012749135.1 hypothetical protein SAMD00019534_110280 [Acytostelium subglobosum LB1]